MTASQTLASILSQQDCRNEAGSWSRLTDARRKIKPCFKKEKRTERKKKRGKKGRAPQQQQQGNRTLIIRVPLYSYSPEYLPYLDLWLLPAVAVAPQYPEVRTESGSHAGRILEEEEEEEGPGYIPSLVGRPGGMAEWIENGFRLEEDIALMAPVYQSAMH